MEIKFDETLHSFLCMRRDVSRDDGIHLIIKQFSLHAQRCFRSFLILFYPAEVFSACAEMFLTSTFRLVSKKRFLCMRRDVSIEKWKKEVKEVFSLHAQRCF